jgi:predicted O-methyltransferase YrrM
MSDMNAHDIYRSNLMHQRILLQLLEIVAESDLEYDDETCRNHATGGSIKFWDGFFLRQLLKQCRPKSILEVGSFLGASTRWLLENSSEWNAKITAIDPNLRHRIFDAPRSVLEKLNSKFIPDRLDVVTAFFGKPFHPYYADYNTYLPHRPREFVDALFKSRPVISGDFDKKFDFIFIDGDHSYEATMENFCVALQLLNPEGVIAFHDVYSWPGVEQAMNTIIEQCGTIGDVVLWGQEMRNNPEFGFFDGIFHFKLR